MELDEVTIAAIGIFLIALILIGAFFGWKLLLLSVGVGATLGVGAAVAIEGRKRLQKKALPPQTEARRCPSCRKRVYENHAVCPHCFHDLKVNCPNCGAVTEVGTACCPSCQQALPATESKSKQLPPSR